jgi:hypothetical protein
MFPREWQETVLFSPITGEKHIADVRTDKGLVVEFQHSVIKPEELKAREDFYGNLVWIVDGCRGPLDSSYFNMGVSGPVSQNPTVYALEWWGRSKLFHNWVRATKPVFFHFGNDIVWRLVFFDPKTKKGALGPMKREDLVAHLRNGIPLQRVV